MGAVSRLDIEADSPRLLMVPLGARCFVETPMSAYGAHRTT